MKRTKYAFHVMYYSKIPYNCFKNISETQDYKQMDSIIGRFYLLIVRRSKSKMISRLSKSKVGH